MIVVTALETPAVVPVSTNFVPYWGKLTVRNDRGDRGNVGIIRSPIRASILPDHKRHHAHGVADPAYDADRWPDTIFPGRHHAAF
jgi:hypothetical protein